MSASEYWFYANPEGRVKILSRDELESAILRGTIDARGFLWKPGQDQWKPMGEITISSLRAVNDLSQQEREIPPRSMGTRWLVLVTSAGLFLGLMYLGLRDRGQSEYAPDMTDEDALRISNHYDEGPRAPKGYDENPFSDTFKGRFSGGGDQATPNTTNEIARFLSSDRQQPSAPVESPTKDRFPDERGPRGSLEEASRSIASIMARTEEGWNQGTGFVVDPQGFVVTNYHIIESADQIRVQLDEEEVLEETAIVAVDPEHDLALLRVGRSNFTALRLGASEDLQVGTEIYVIGNPLGLRRSITSGLLSAHRSVEGVDLLQLSAPISPGSSGSPILDRNGDVVGVVVGTVEAGQNLNFAIPVEYLHDILMNPLAFSVRSQKEGASEEFKSYVELGHLDMDNSTLETGRLYEVYEVELRESQRVRLSIRSDDFDPYLLVFKPSREVLQNDDVAGGTDLSAGLDIIVDESGEWSIIVTSYEKGEVGEFELRVEFLAPSDP